jgi:hypothetical protein
MDKLLERFSEQAPVAVMARLGLQRAIGAEWVNEVLEEHSASQYTRELLFSTVVELMSLVALGLRPSLHAAAQGGKASPPASITALYDKVNRVEPAVVRALVAGSAKRLAPVMKPLRRASEPPLPGWKIRIIDGSHLPGSEKRLAPLRGFRGATPSSPTTPTSTWLSISSLARMDTRASATCFLPLWRRRHRANSGSAIASSAPRRRFDWRRAGAQPVSVKIVVQQIAFRPPAPAFESDSSLGSG